MRPVPEGNDFATLSPGRAGRSDPLPPTSLVLCTRNRPGLLRAAVDSILAGHELPTELIIVDQSDDPNPELNDAVTDAATEVRYRWSRALGLSLANNEGIAAARHGLLVFTHDDVRVPPEWFGTLVRSLLHAGPRAVVTGQVRPEKEGRKGGFVPSTKVDETPAVYEGRVLEGVLYPMNMALYRSALEEVGRFDERLGPGTPYPAAEDNDLASRLLEAGYRIHYVPAAALYHRAWRSRRDYLPLRWSYGRGQGAYYAKYLARRDRHMLERLSRESLERLRRCAVRLVGQPLGGLGEVIYLAGLLSGVAQWLLTERGGRRVG